MSCFGAEGAKCFFLKTSLHITGTHIGNDGNDHADKVNQFITRCLNDRGPSNNWLMNISWKDKCCFHR